MCIEVGDNRDDLGFMVDSYRAEMLSIMKAVVHMWRKLIMQYKVSQRNWPRLKCAVEVAINSRPSSVMGGKSPYELAMVAPRKVPSVVTVELGDDGTSWITKEIQLTRV